MRDSVRVCIVCNGRSIRVRAGVRAGMRPSLCAAIRECPQPFGSRSSMRIDSPRVHMHVLSCAALSSSCFLLVFLCECASGRHVRACFHTFVAECFHRSACASADVRLRLLRSCKEFVKCPHRDDGCACAYSARASRTMAYAWF
eukprot:6201925-Pleurochrysis_carterae.AAC.4